MSRAGNIWGMKRSAMLDTLHRYNALDAIHTLRLAKALLPKIHGSTYRAEMALQRACWAISERGIRLDPGAVDRAIVQLEADAAGAPEGVNPRSPKAVREWLRAYNIEYASTDAQTLEKIASGGFTGKHTPAEAERIIQFATDVLRVRRASKLLGYLKEMRGQERAYFTLSPGSTETFRLSSSRHPVFGGFNIQTIPPALRACFVPDPGWTLVYADIRRAESEVVAHLADDPAYKQIHAVDDMHVEMARRLWPTAGWTGDPAADAKLAREPGFVRHMSRRDAAKRCTHGLAYGATAHSICRTAGIPLAEAQRAVDMFFQSFPGVLRWQREVDRQLKTGEIRYPWGYLRKVPGKDRHSREALRSILASLPQSVVAWTTHLVMVRGWLAEGPHLQVLAHLHDAILYQVRGAGADALDVHVRWPELGWEPKWDFHVGPNWGDVS